LGSSTTADARSGAAVEGVVDLDDVLREEATVRSSKLSAVPRGSGPVVIRTLGRFEVSLAGVPVPTSAWQFRKARDLLRILVAGGDVE
jgi:hypothetical protein